MNYYIFGANGFIGTHLGNHIYKNSQVISSIGRYDLASAKPGISYLDVRKPINLTVEPAKHEIIFNLAAVHKTPGHPDPEYFETNIQGAENICNFARAQGIQTIAFTSSIAPYGASEDVKNEDTLPMPNTPYGISKLVAEHIHRTWQAEDPEHRKLIIVRPGVVFGQGEGGNYSRLYAALKKGFFMYPGRKDTLKACVYVKDVARILYESAVHAPVGVHLYNLTYAPAPTIEMICNEISAVTGVPRPRYTIPGALLRGGAQVLALAGGISGNLLNGVHPDRVRKLMVSTNIDGSKLASSPYKLQFSLREALEDWYQECDGKGLF